MAPGRIRTFGTLGGLLLPGLLVVLAVLLWVVSPSSGVGGATTLFASYFFALLGVPTLLLTGLPLYGGAWRLAAAVVTSGVLWLALGRWAGGRATRDVDGTWRDWIAEMLAMTIGVWAGLVLGLIAVVLILNH